MDDDIKILQGNSLEVVKTLPDASINCVVTSPPYFGLRDYGMAEQIGLEETPIAYVEKLVSLFQEIRRVLRDDGTLWINLGDSYASNSKGQEGGSKKQRSNQGASYVVRKFSYDGIKEKDLVGIPWLVALALREDGWYLRQDIIWHKNNSFPESVKDRCTKTHEYIFLLSKKDRYYFDQESIKEQIAGTTGDYRVKRSVWTVNNQTYHGAHFATYPPALIMPCILAGCPEGGTVLDPFFGSGTTGVVCKNLNRKCIGIELNPKFVEVAKIRLSGCETKEEIQSSKMDFETWDT